MVSQSSGLPTISMLSTQRDPGGGEGRSALGEATGNGMGLPSSKSRFPALKSKSFPYFRFVESKNPLSFFSWEASSLILEKSPGIFLPPGNFLLVLLDEMIIKRYDFLWS